MDRGGKSVELTDDKGGKDIGGREIGGFDDDGGGGEEAGVSDDGEGEEVDRRGEVMGMLDVGREIKGGVSDDEVSVWGWEDGTEDPSVDAEDVDGPGKMHCPRRSTPRGHVAVGEEEVEGVWDD